ncbi:MAG: protease complex subunit PrcB family protein [Lachnospiraceae bacterium]
MKHKLFSVFFTLCAAFLLYGCGIEKYDDTKINDLDYAVLAEEDIPEPVLQIIEKSKSENFRKTYTDGSFLYIIIGYGAQPTTNYSITIEDLYEAKNAIFVSSMLKGPSKKEIVVETETYPYVVLKLQYSDKTVIFK